MYVLKVGVVVAEVVLAVAAAVLIVFVVKCVFLSGCHKNCASRPRPEGSGISERHHAQLARIENSASPYHLAGVDVRV